MGYIWNFKVVWENLEFFQKGIYFTLLMSAQVYILSLLLSVLFLIGLKSRFQFLRFIIGGCLEVFRNIPLLVFLIWVYYALPILINLKITAWEACLWTFALNLSGFLTASLKGKLESIPRSQYHSGLVLGLNKVQIWYHIILPQVFRASLPDLLNFLILAIKSTSLASVIAIPELLYQSNVLISNTYRPLEVYSVLALCYTLILLPLSLGAGLLGKKLQLSTKNL